MTETATATWVPARTDVPLRGKPVVAGTDPETFNSLVLFVKNITDGPRPTGVRTLFCRDAAHGECAEHGARIYEPTPYGTIASPRCGCGCHV